MRMMGMILSTIVLLSILSLSYELDVWTFLGEGANKIKGMANAFPIPKSGIQLDRAEAEPIPELSSDSQDDEDYQNQFNPYDHFVTHPPSTKIPTTETITTTTTQTTSTTISSFSSNAAEDSFVNSPVKNSSSSSTSSSLLSSTVAKEKSMTAPSFKRTRAKAFLVVFLGHSGSTAFTTELRQHSDFIVEKLEPLEHDEFQFDTDKALKRARELMNKGIRKGKIPGFKIRPNHINARPKDWQKFVQEYDARIIWQFRENILKQAVGEYRNRVLNDSSVVEGLRMVEKPCAKGSGQKCRFKVDNFEALHNLMNSFSVNDDLLGKAVRNLDRSEDMTIVRYEDYLYDRLGIMGEVFDFLGVEYENTAAQRVKASPDSLCDMVSNFVELCEHFYYCSLWRPFLEDRRNGCQCLPPDPKKFKTEFCKRDAWYQAH